MRKNASATGLALKLGKRLDPRAARLPQTHARAPAAHPETRMTNYDVLCIGNAIVDIIAAMRRRVPGRQRHHQGRDEPDRRRARRTALQPHGPGDRSLRRQRRQHGGRRRQLRRPRRLLRQGVERRARRHLRPRHPRARRRLRHQAAERPAADGALDDLRHARRRALDEHLSRRLRRARARRCRGRQGCRRQGHLFRGLSVGSAARQGGDPADGEATRTRPAAKCR